MEQDILDSSKFKISLVSLDSRFADLRSCNNGEFKLMLPYPMKNVIRIRLASTEIPLVEYVFSEAYGNLTCAVKLSGSSTFTKVPPLGQGNYTVAQLLTALETNLQTLDANFDVALNPNTGAVTISNTTYFEFYGISYNKEIATQLSFWGLGYYLGFRFGTVCSNLNPATGRYEVTGSAVVDVAPNRYYLLQLWCPDNIANVSHRLQDKGFLDCFAKVILKNGQFTNSYDDNANLVRKEWTWVSPFQVPFFRVALLNPYGKPVDMQNMNWSLTVEVTEVVNSKTYTLLNQTYERK